MTREEKLWSMTMRALLEEAEKAGVKIDRKGAKEKAIAKILAAETAEQEKETVQEPETVEQEQETAPETVQETAEQETKTAEQETTEEPKKERKPREKKENPLRPVFKNWVEETAKKYGYSFKTWESQPNLWQIKAPKTVAEIRWGLKGWMINTKQLTADCISAVYYLQKNYNLPAVIKLSYDDLGKDVFEALLIQCQPE